METLSSQHMRCVVCGEVISLDRNNTSDLLEHLNNFHPAMCVARFDTSAMTRDNGNIADYEDDRRKLSSQQSVQSTCSPRVTTITSTWPSKHRNHKKQLYQTTMETWRPGRAELPCARCGKSGPPAMRSQRNRYSSSWITAFCTLGLWPFCFLPMLVGKPSVLRLFCSSCGAYLGDYNPKSSIQCPCSFKAPTAEPDYPLCAAL